VPASPLDDLANRAVDLVDCELEILRTELNERLACPTSNVIWAAKGCKTKILELAGALFRSGELTTGDGSPLIFADVVEALCIAFNLDVQNMYVQRNQVRNRSKGAAQFLRRLVAILEKDSDDFL
jgi:hypothetical protein